MAPYAPVLRPLASAARQEGRHLGARRRLYAAARSEPKGLVGWIELGALPQPRQFGRNIRGRKISELKPPQP